MAAPYEVVEADRDLGEVQDPVFVGVQLREDPIDGPFVTSGALLGRLIAEIALTSQALLF